MDEGKEMILGRECISFLEVPPPKKFGTKSCIDVDRPLSRLQRFNDKNRHQIRTWMAKLFPNTATWEMLEQA